MGKLQFHYNKIFLIASLMFFLPSFSLFAQEPGDGFGVLMGANLSLQQYSGSISDIYGYQQKILGAAFGLGYGQSFLVGRYKKVHLDAASQVKNIDVEGKASMNQEFISAGIRAYSSKIFVVEISHQWIKMDETIGTVNPVITQLAASNTISRNALGLLAGLSLPISILRLQCHVEYLVYYEELSKVESQVKPSNFSVGFELNVLIQ